MLSDFITLPNSDITSIAIGRFDGMHIGHFALFEQLDKNGAIALIDTQKANLTPPFDLKKYTNLPIAIYKLDNIVTLTPSDFIKKLINDFPNLDKIVVGHDFRFGSSRQGDTEALKKLFLGKTIIVDEIKIDDIGVHSKLIRSYLQDGKIKKANKFLGREYSLSGNVIRGQGIGAQKLLATINLSVTNYFLPREGIYAGFYENFNTKYKAVIFIGKRLCTDGNFAIEAHLLEECPTELDSFGTLFLIDFIRDNRFYPELEQLKKQMQIDTKKARQILENES